jgi:hypothetical protein
MSKEQSKSVVSDYVTLARNHLCKSNPEYRERITMQKKLKVPKIGQWYYTSDQEPLYLHVINIEYKQDKKPLGRYTWMITTLVYQTTEFFKSHSSENSFLPAGYDKSFVRQKHIDVFESWDSGLWQDVKPLRDVVIIAKLQMMFSHETLSQERKTASLKVRS